MNKDPYEGFAERYDLFFGRFGEHRPDYKEFFRKLFAENRVRSVLDCACGTGNDLHLLNSLGYEVVGSDISESMLRQAQRNLSKQGLQIPLHQLDYRELLGHFEQRFDAVICTSSAIMEMPYDAQVLRAFRSMHSVLCNHEILVLSQGTSDRQWREKPRFLLAFDRPELTRMFAIDYYEGRRARYNVIDICHGEQSNALTVWSRGLYILLRDDYEKLLKRAGFQAVDFYGDLHFTPYEKETSNQLIVVAHK